ncbi:MAG: adenylyl-sulfate kinase [Rhodospirillaceae bacterium]|nr:adenylyl-sulfate kinase [Rhodospirillaceae bacterium]
MVIWITGLSGAGKTTVCENIVRMMKPSVPELVVLDGDVVREIFNDQLGHTEVDRIRQIKRIQRLAKELDTQGLVVLVAALYAHSDLLNWNRENFSNYAEIYLDAPIELVQSRDPKGLYEKVRVGEMKHVVGIDIPWNAPLNPTLTIKMTDAETPNSVSEKIISAIPHLSARLASAMQDA